MAIACHAWPWVAFGCHAEPWLPPSETGEGSQPCVCGGGGVGGWGGGERGTVKIHRQLDTSSFRREKQGKLEERRCRAEFGTVDVWVKTH